MQIRAHAKVNLDLRILCKRADGFHELRSIVAFSSLCDTLSIIKTAPSNTRNYTYDDIRLTLCVASDVKLDDAFFPNNLIYKTAKLLRSSNAAPTTLLLEKHIPLGAGLGGGSTDAAATLRLLNDAWKLELPQEKLHAFATQLGSDVAACLTPKAQIMSGRGEVLQPLDIQKNLWILLIYPHIHLAAGDVYRAGDFTEQQPHEPPQEFPDKSALLTYLQTSGNDLTAPAIKLAPVLAVILATLENLPDAKLARISGSGSACFALFDDEQAAISAQKQFASKYPDYWNHLGKLLF